MLSQEWPLVVFTLLVQTAIGIVFAGECMLCRTTDAGARRGIRRQSVIAFALFAVAGLVSLGHTGNPFNSFYTIMNIGSSWLSREIAMLGVTGAAFLGLAFFRMKSDESSSEKLLAALVVIAGLLLVATMSRVYRLSVAPTWDSWYGLLAFFGSVFLMGVLWQGMASGSSAKTGPALTMTAFLGLILAGASAPFGVPFADSAVVNPSTVLAPASCLAASLALRLALATAGVALLTLFAIRSQSSNGASRFLPVLGFLLVVAGEFIGRAAFYASYTRVGM